MRRTKREPNQSSIKPRPRFDTASVLAQRQPTVAYRFVFNGEHERTLLHRGYDFFHLHFFAPDEVYLMVIRSQLQ